MKIRQPWPMIGLSLSLIAGLVILWLGSSSFQQPPNLQQRFETVAASYLGAHFDKSLTGTTRTLLTNEALDAKVVQALNSVCPARKKHYSYLLSKYKDAPFRAALLVTGAQAPAPDEFLMFSLPAPWRVTSYPNIVHAALVVSSLQCDTVPVWRGKHTAGGGNFSVFSTDFEANSDCICTETCGTENENSYCPSC